MNRLRIFKEVWQNSKQMKTNTNGSKEMVQEDQNSNVPPPQYTECPSKYSSGDQPPDSNTLYPRLVKYATRTKHFRRNFLIWALVEIVAVSFDADCQKIKATIARSHPNFYPRLRIQDSSTTTDEGGRAAITELCALVRNLREAVEQIRWLLVSKRDKDLIDKLVLEPVNELTLNLDFVLQMLGRYKRVEGYRRPESTLVDYWMPTSPSTGLADTIASHAILIRYFRLQPEIHLVLADCIATFQKEKGLEALRTSHALQAESVWYPGRTCCWPLEKIYRDLAGGVRGLQTGGVICDPFAASRGRLIEKENEGDFALIVGSEARAT